MSLSSYSGFAGLVSEAGVWAAFFRLGAVSVVVAFLQIKRKYCHKTFKCDYNILAFPMQMLIKSRSEYQDNKERTDVGGSSENCFDVGASRAGADTGMIAALVPPKGKEHQMKETNQKINH